MMVSECRTFLLVGEKEEGLLHMGLAGIWV